MSGAGIARTRLAQARAGWAGQAAMVAGVIFAILLLFARDAADMAAIWWTSSTYGHCLLVLPIIGWLVYQRAGALARIAPRLWLGGVPIAALGGAAWLTGDVAGVALGRHLGLVLMMQGAVITLIGRSTSQYLFFPIGYAIFLIPFGEELIPPLQRLTADMSMALLDLAGIPARIDGVFITTPNGWFKVAEACAGVNFLMAMLAYAVLIAHVGFRSWPRRIAFIAMALIVPVLANGLRAFGTIWYAYHTSAEQAAGFDHIVYGFIFFAIVLAIVTAIGWRFFDRKREELPATIPPSGPNRPGLAIGALGAAILLPHAWGTAVAARPGDALPAVIHLPDPAGWSRAIIGGAPWAPLFDGADHQLIGRYRDGRGNSVDIAVAVYAKQAEGRELVGYGQGEAPGWAWADDRVAPPSGRAYRTKADGGIVREVAAFYRIGGMTTGDARRVKLETLRTRLLGGPQVGTALLVSAEGAHARPAIDAFLRSIGPVDGVIDTMIASR